MNHLTIITPPCHYACYHLSDSLMSSYPSTPSSSRLSLSPLLPSSNRTPTKPSIPTDKTLKRRLLRKGVDPTPKILHRLRKKETLKSIRKAKKQALAQDPPPFTNAQKLALAEDERFRTIRAEYREIMRELTQGRPWERDKNVNLGKFLGTKEEVSVKGEHLLELRDMLKERNQVKFQWLLDDDLEEEEDVTGGEEGEKYMIQSKKRILGDEQKVKLLVKSLRGSEMDLHDWRFVRLMKQSDIIFHEMNLLQILKGLEEAKNWRQAFSIVKWVYSQKAYLHRKSRFVYTKLLSVLGKGMRPIEALQIYKEMLGEAQIYPDMAAYHSIAVTLGQAGMVHELINIIETMRKRPPRHIKMRNRDRDPTLEPDVVIYNAVLNGCIPSSQWKGVYWVFDRMRYSCIEPNAASFGLAMEVMLNAGKCELVHKFFERMKKNGLATQAITYKVLVKCLWKEDKIDDAVEAVRDMERRGIVGASCVYYELACCLCNKGRWHDAMLEIDKLKKLPRTKPLEVAFTGMLVSSFKGGYINDCISIFEQMKEYCNPNTGAINSMLRIYGTSDMFARAKDLFESMSIVFQTKANEYTYSIMLEASASALQWEYFEFVYREMTLAGYLLDQRKHTSLIVEASKFGKSSLLEHAFDTILEAGDIPSVAIFMELICLAISESDFQRTLNLINGMAHASLKVNESKWTNLFRENMDRFREDALVDLLNYVKSGHIVSEEPATSFVRSLERFSGTNLLEAPNSKVIVEEPEKKCLKVGKWKWDTKASPVDEVLDSLTTNVGNIFDELPSANEILQMWEQERTDTCL